MPKDIIDARIREYVNEVCLNGNIPELQEYIETDSFGEVLDKLIIVHIRTWMLEDSIGKDSSDTEFADTKRKIDVCFKQKRPKLIAAINKLIDKAVVEGRVLAEENLKMYKQ